MEDAQHAAARTADGEPIATTPPYGAAVVVHRRTGERWEYLTLHRAHHGPDFDGEWAWGPPSGARFPGEDADRCAARELFEETGLRLAPQPVETDSRDWLVYCTEADPNAQMRLSPEHDRFAWLPLGRAVAVVTPERVRAQIASVASLVESRDPGSEA